MKKYLVCPGTVRSLNDGDIHHIGFMDLCRLYGVSPDESVNIENVRAPQRGQYDGLIKLFPRESGDYTLPSTDTAQRNQRTCILT
jgi:hypothetical protein